jgi:hypothetical protein
MQTATHGPVLIEFGRIKRKIILGKGRECRFYPYSISYPGYSEQKKAKNTHGYPFGQI